MLLLRGDDTLATIEVSIEHRVTNAGAGAANTGIRQIKPRHLRTMSCKPPSPPMAFFSDQRKRWTAR
jgi:hypothetical protein